MPAPALVWTGHTKGRLPWCLPFTQGTQTWAAQELTGQGDLWGGTGAEQALWMATGAPLLCTFHLIIFCLQLFI